MQVIKRDGRTEEFDREKIKRAVVAASDKNDDFYGLSTTLAVVRILENKYNSPYHVNDINDIVENVLYTKNLVLIARKYMEHHANKHNSRVLVFYLGNYVINSIIIFMI